jgi:hypothetical protein
MFFSLFTGTQNVYLMMIKVFMFFSLFTGTQNVYLMMIKVFMFFSLFTGTQNVYLMMIKVFMFFSLFTGTQNVYLMISVFMFFFIYRYTERLFDDKKNVYATALQWPSNNTLFLGAPIPTEQTTVSLLGLHQEIKWTKGKSGGMNLIIPPIPYNEMPCRWAWVFKISGLQNT